ncbi:MAG: CRISPR-associated endonuclease Cas3'', partial [Candidatus Kapabacteria bacterium]|nr:CRISPR-associated endonuclease Cas3'' [Candidatus Kapabacteria bacterium]
DVGKFHPKWQQYIRSQTNENTSTEESILSSHSPGRPRHSGVGALAAWAIEGKNPLKKVAAYCIAGHHAGLDDWFGGLEARLNDPTEQQLYQTVSALFEAQPFLSAPLPTEPPCIIQDKRLDAEQLHLWIRMIFSCLVDADFLDTEAFIDPERAQLRQDYPSLQSLYQRYQEFMDAKERNAPDTPINRLRRAIRAECLSHADDPPGFFSLTVPTGGGKTLASIGFALAHACTHNLRRIIVAIPYTSIIEQTAAVLRYGTDDPNRIASMAPHDMLFADAVVEHHSNLDLGRDSLRNRLASENWDAPIIVTTTVQLFESLFAASPSACRKLHNIARSVIILDEVQLLPPEHLRSILSVLRGLVNYFGVSVVLMTATQPVLEGTIGAPPSTINGLEAVRPLVSNPQALAQQFDRVDAHFPSPNSQPISWEELRDQLCQHRQVLCIVNSRKDCRDLHALMPPGTVHLSALMCPEDRSVTLARIKHALHTNQEIRVISTQLVEAGVDIDFPVVYRALAGLDSIAQAAGRCNREGTLPHRGNLYVFIPPRRSPPGLLRKGEDTTRELLSDSLALQPEHYQRYFQKFYACVNTFDSAQFDECFVKNATTLSFAFRTFADRFAIVDSQQQVGVIVRYTNPHTGVSSEPLIERLRAGQLTRDLLRQLQRYSVNLYRKEAQYAAERGYIQHINGFWVQVTDQFYVPGLGVQLDDTAWFDCVV